MDGASAAVDDYMAERHFKPYLVGDHLALDFLNSQVGRGGEPRDWLNDGAGLLAWLTEAGAIDGSVARRLRRRDESAENLDGVAEQARELREWLGEFVDRHAGRVVGRDAFAELGSLNRLLARDDTYRQIAQALTNAAGAGPSRALQSIQIRRWTTPDRLLQPIAETISDLICNADFRLVRRCEGDGCILTFYDRTKTHARRWCSMAVCRKRAQAAAHRAKMQLVRRTD